MECVSQTFGAPHRHIHFPVVIKIRRGCEGPLVDIQIQQRASLDQKIDPDRSTASSGIEQVSTRTTSFLAKNYSLSCVGITLPSIPVILIHTTMTLHTTHRPTDHTNRRIQRGRIAPWASQRLLLIDEQVVQDER